MITEKGIVSHIYENKGNDVIIRLENNDRFFYINRGLEHGLAINILKEKLMGNEVVLKYPKYWTPMDWNDTTKHLSRVENDNEIIYEELAK